MKKAIIAGILFSLLLLVTPINNNLSQSTDDIAKASTINKVHPILPPVG
ncbi:hypothetical protein J2Y03_004147 [Neobacillus niacini]|nr:hypothetical protein [Neobacillus niacini]MDR7079090.1 hypothetical protein [Neobacillus niacini]